MTVLGLVHLQPQVRPGPLHGGDGGLVVTPGEVDVVGEESGGQGEEEGGVGCEGEAGHCDLGCNNTCIVFSQSAGQEHLYELSISS